MKTMKTTLMSLVLFITSMTATAQPMSYYAMRENARFLTDRMAYTLGIATSLLDDLYMINFDYICGVNDYLDDVAYGYHYDDYMTVLYARDAALRRLLTPYQWTRLVALDYFYRPISFVDRRWTFSIYAYDPYRTRFYYHVPHHYNDYRGGHFFRGMAPAGGRIGGPHGGPNRPQHGNTGGPGYRIGDGNMNHGGGNMNGNRNDHGGGDMNGNRNMNRGGNTNGAQPDRRDNNINVRTLSGTGAGSQNVRSGGSVMTERPSSTRSTSTGVSSGATRGGGRSVGSSAPTQSVRSNTSAPVRSTSSGSSAGSSSGGSRSVSSGAGRGGNGGGGSRGGGRR